jgi:hypothetical protein
MEHYFSLDDIIDAMMKLRVGVFVSGSKMMEMVGVE